MVRKGRGEEQTGRLKNYRAQRGQALTELALILPVLVTLFLGVAEVGNALKAYLTIVEASRDGARLVAREGRSADVKGLVETLTERLPPSTLNVRVTTNGDNSGGQMVTVEVQYDYRIVFSSVPFVERVFRSPLTLTASTTMPIP